MGRELSNECTVSALMVLVQPQQPANLLKTLVGAARIELATTCSQSRYATAALRPVGRDYPMSIRRKSPRPGPHRHGNAAESWIGWKAVPKMLE